MEITATYKTRRFQDSGSDGAPDYYVHVFTNIKDQSGKKYPDEKWIKETKLTQAVPFSKGKVYRIKLSERYPGFKLNSVNMPYPVDISWNEGRVYMKNGNSIIRVNSNEEEENLSEPVNRPSGTDNFIKGIFNKFMDGRLTIELLEKANVRGVYFTVKYFDPQDKRVFYNTSYSQNAVQNTIIIEKETQAEIDDALMQIKQRTVKGDVINKFKIVTKILPPKKRRPAKK